MHRATLSLALLSLLVPSPVARADEAEDKAEAGPKKLGALVARDTSTPAGVAELKKAVPKVEVTR
jgi:hypothetical protein